MADDTLTRRFRESASRLPEPITFGSDASPRDTLPLPLAAAGYAEQQHPAPVPSYPLDAWLIEMTRKYGHCGQ